MQVGIPECGFSHLRCSEQLLKLDRAAPDYNIRPSTQEVARTSSMPRDEWARGGGRERDAARREARSNERYDEYLNTLSWEEFRQHFYDEEFVDDDGESLDGKELILCDDESPNRQQSPVTSTLHTVSRVLSSAERSIAPTTLVVCPTCACPVAQKNLEKHLHKVHGTIGKDRKQEVPSTHSVAPTVAKKGPAVPAPTRKRTTSAAELKALIAVLKSRLRRMEIRLVELEKVESQTR